MNITYTLSLLFILTSPFSILAKSNRATKDITLLSTSAPSLKIDNKPYITNYTLGESLILDGLVVEKDENGVKTTVEDYTVGEIDINNLGKQVIEIYGDDFYTYFNVFVSNRNVKSYASVTRDLFISEISLINNQNYLEIYNNTSSSIDLSSYQIEIESSDNKIISLGVDELTSKTSLVLQSGDYDFSLDSFATLSLQKNEIVIDQITRDQEEIDFFNATSEFSNTILRRHHQVHNGAISFNPEEWINVGSDTSNFALHQVIDNIVSVPNQARAFARYVMYGAGMFAAGRVEEAFIALRDEFNLMEDSAKEYFIENKDEEVQGINEEGNLDTATFKEAQGRIGVLASTSGHNSFLPSSGTSFNLGDTTSVLIISGVAILLIGGYVIFRLKTRRQFK